MEILEVYRKHCSELKNKIENKTKNEIIDLILAVSQFYFNFPFDKIIKTHIFIDINQDKLLKDLKTDELSFYRDANKKALDGIDLYAPEYEEIDQMELSVLNSFSYMINENKKESLFGLFDEIITVLDYYEQFSDRPQHWNKILEKELKSQVRLINAKEIDLKYYCQIYNEIEFEEL